VIEDVVALEQSILADPNIGDLVRGTGGLRKVRVGSVQPAAANAVVFASTISICPTVRSRTWSPSSGSARRTTSPRVSAKRLLPWFAR
jgi:hypothetical protein